MDTNLTNKTLAHSGFVSIIGRPNAGKSTLLNAILGEHLSIVTHKAQTTRHRIQGILSGDDYQIVFSDTPGTLKPAHKLHEKMMGFVNESFADADVFVYMIDLDDRWEDDEFVQKLKKMETPVIAVLNKMDISTPAEVNARMEQVKEILNPNHILAISVLKKFNVDTLLELIKSLLPEGPYYYDPEQLTDRSERFIAAEMIREQIMTAYQEEVPYNVEVVIESFKDHPTILKIEATIYVMRDSQKAILIGKGGSKLKMIGSRSRHTMEKFWKKQVFLHTFVKVKENWRNDEGLLKQFGYE